MATIEQILEAANKASFVHFPQGLLIYKKARWCVRVLSKDTETVESGTPHATGETPEEAINNLAEKLAGDLRERARRARTDADEQFAAAETLEAKGA